MPDSICPKCSYPMHEVRWPPYKCPECEKYIAPAELKDD